VAEVLGGRGSLGAHPFRTATRLTRLRSTRHLRELSTKAAAASREGRSEAHKSREFSAADTYFLVLERSWGFTATLLLTLEVAAVLSCTILCYIPGVDLLDTAMPDLPLVEFRFAANNLITMGFGTVVPGNHAAFAMGILQCALGVLLNVLIFADIVTKFQRPKGKLVFAEKACFATRNGEPVVIVRVGNLRQGLTLVHVSAQPEPFLFH